MFGAVLVEGANCGGVSACGPPPFLGAVGAMGGGEGCRNENERALTVTRSQRAGLRNGGLQGLTVRARRACVHRTNELSGSALDVRAI